MSNVYWQMKSIFLHDFCPVRFRLNRTGFRSKNMIRLGVTKPKNQSIIKEASINKYSRFNLT